MNLRRIGELECWVPSKARDSWLIELACLEAGASTWRVRPQLVLALIDQHVAPLGFSGTASPGTSTLNRRIMNHRGLRRQVLLDAGVPVPVSRVFPIKDGVHAIKYANHLGYPVVVKGFSRGRDDAKAVYSEKALRSAIGELRAPTLRDLRSRPTDRLIVEKYVPGSNYTFIVVGSDVKGVIFKNARGRDALAKGDGLTKAHSSFERLAMDAVAAMPSLDHGEVVIRATDVSRPAAEQEHAVVSLAFDTKLRRPELSVNVSYGLARDVVFGALNLTSRDRPFAAKGAAEGRATLMFKGAEGGAGFISGLQSLVEDWGSWVAVDFEEEGDFVICRAEGSLVDIGTLASLVFQRPRRVQSSEIRLG